MRGLVLFGELREGSQLREVVVRVHGAYARLIILGQQTTWLFWNLHALVLRVAAGLLSAHRSSATEHDDALPGGGSAQRRGQARRAPCHRMVGSVSC